MTKRNVLWVVEQHGKENKWYPHSSTDLIREDARQHCKQLRQDWILHKFRITKYVAER